MHQSVVVPTSPTSGCPRPGVGIVTLLKHCPPPLGHSFGANPHTNRWGHQTKGWQQKKTSTGLTNAPPMGLPLADNPHPVTWGRPRWGEWGQPLIGALFMTVFSRQSCNCLPKLKLLVVELARVTRFVVV